MKKNWFLLVIVLIGSLTVTSCIDKLMKGLNNATAQAQVDDMDDDDMDDGDDMDYSDDGDDDMARFSGRHSRGGDDGEAPARSEYNEDDDEVATLLNKIARRNRESEVSMREERSIDRVLSERRLTDDDLYGMSATELSILRNTIYARHGYRFTRDDLFNYFSMFDWYTPVTSDMTTAYNSMSATERYNVDFIRRHER